MMIDETVPTKVKALELFGFTGQMLQAAIWRIKDSEVKNRFLWFPLDGDYRFGTNTLSRDGKMFTDARTSNFSTTGEYGKHDPSEERIIFLRSPNVASPLRFIGVFKPHPSSSGNSSIWNRVSEECSPRDGSWLSATL